MTPIPVETIAAVKCREAFENWKYTDPSFSQSWLHVDPDREYYSVRMRCDWKSWQAAWNTRASTPDAPDVESLRAAVRDLADFAQECRDDHPYPEISAPVLDTHAATIAGCRDQSGER